MNSVKNNLPVEDRRPNKVESFRDLRKKDDDDKRLKEKRFNASLQAELESMVLVSVKGEQVSDTALLNSEISEERPSKTNDLIQRSIQDIQSKFSKELKEGQNLVEDDNGQMVNIDKNSTEQKHFVLNVNGENILLSENQKDNIKKQIELLENFDNSNVLIKVKDNAKFKFMRKSTDDLITKHREFLDKFKGMIRSARQEVDVMKQMEDQNSQIKDSINYINKKNENFFEGLISDLHKSKITKKPFEMGEEIKRLNEEFGVQKVFSGKPVVEQSKAEGSLINDLNKELSKIENVTGNSLANNNGQFSQDGGKENSTFDAKELLKTTDLKNIIGEQTQKSTEPGKTENLESSRNYKFFNNVRIKDIMTNTLKAIKDLPENGSTMARMTLNPKSLGKVFVEIIMINNKAQINFKSETKEVMRAIESQIENLSVKLADQGIITEAIELSLNDKDFTKDGANSMMKHFAQKEDAKARQEFLDSFKKLNENKQ